MSHRRGPLGFTRMPVSSSHAYTEENQGLPP